MWLRGARLWMWVVSVHLAVRHSLGFGFLVHGAAKQMLVGKHKVIILVGF